MYSLIYFSLIIPTSQLISWVVTSQIISSFDEKFTTYLYQNVVFWSQFKFIVQSVHIFVKYNSIVNNIFTIYNILV